MYDDTRHRLLGRWAGFIGRRPRSTLLIAGVVTVICLWYSSTQLKFQSDRNELVSPELPWNQRFVDWQTSFPGTQDLVVVVDVGSANPPAERFAGARSLADALGEAIQNSGGAADGGVVWRFERSRAHPRAIRLLPMDEFDLELRRIADAGTLVHSRSPQEFIGHVQSQLRAGGDPEKPAEAVAGIRQFAGIIDAFGQVLAAPPDNVPRLEDLTSGQTAERWAYLISENGRLLFIRVTPRKAQGELNPLEPAIEKIRAAMTPVTAKHPQFEVGLTGIEVVEADETDTAITDATFASTASFILIAIMLVLAYHSFKTPLLAMVALAVGVTWAFGFTTLAIGHLQILSVIFAAMLLGISDAYGVHIVANYELIRRRFHDDERGFLDALRQSFQTVGPGVLTGAVVTAAAFMTTLFTDFRGVAEMGLISGVGIFLCLLAMFTVYPALIRLFKWRHKDVVPPEDRWVTFYSDRWVMPFIRRPKITLGVAAVLLAGSAVAITQMRFDYDLLKLLPRHVDSVEWARRIAEDGGTSIYTGVSIADNLEQARERAERFRALPSVERVLGVGLLFAPDEAEKMQRIRAVRERLGVRDAGTQPATAAAAPTPSFYAALQGLRVQLAFATMMQVPAEVKAALAELDQTLNRVINLEARWTDTERAQREAQLQRAYEGWRASAVGALDAGPMQLADLPAEILRPYIASDPNDPRVILDVFPRLPDPATTRIDSALHPRFLPGFVRDLRTVDPNVTGVIVQVYESGSLIKWSYIKAGLISLAIVFTVVLLDFWSLEFALLSLVPVIVGFAITFAAMWLFGVSINPANIIILPLMFGIGMDSGVHILHRYRQEPTSRPLGLTSGTGKGITITALTTIVAFATMIPARHRGISSLGFVLSVGLTLTLLACVTVMPAWLELRQRRVEKKKAHLEPSPS